MSQNPDEPRESATPEAGFESGLDYGAFASAEPDYPEDHLDEDSSNGSAGSAESPSQDDVTVPAASTNPAHSFGEQPTETVSPYPEDHEPTPEQPAQATDSAVSAQPSAEQLESEDFASEQPTTVIAPSSSDQQASEQATTVVPPVAAEQPTTALPVEPEPEAAPASTAPSPSPSETGVLTGGAAAGTAAPAVATARHQEHITDEDIDEEVKKSKRGISRFFTILTAVFTPVILIVAAVHVVASPIFLYITYWRPGFPEDTGGWGLADRLLYGSYGTDYLTNLANSRYLDELAPGGERLFTEAEVSHMTDVKLVMWWATLIAVVLVVLVFIMYLMLRAWRPGGLARALFAGAWATLGVLIGLAVLAILDWQRFFTGFHNVLFPQGNWQFATDSTLIRLYPEQFWMDAGIWLVALLVIFSLALLIATWPTKRRRARRAARLEEVHDRRREKLIEELNASAG